MWHQADRYRVPRIAFVNKMDRVGADFQRVLEMMRERLGARPVAVQLPVGSEGDFRGVIDLLAEKALIWPAAGSGETWSVEPIPEELRADATAARERVLEAAADTDEQLLARYLEGEPISADQIRKALRQATLELSVVPVFCGAAFRNKGVQPLLDGIVDYLPSPLDVPPVEGVVEERGRTRTEVRRADPNEPFKLMTDRHVGHLSYMRVYSGTVSSGQMILNSRKGRKERIGRLLRMHANKRQEVDEARAGDIVAAVGLKLSVTGDTLCDPRHPIVLEPMEFPEPVISIAIEPRTQADMDKLAQALDRLSREDPTFRVTIDEETGQTLVAGMGELHLEVIVDRLVREFGVDANVGRPQVAYKETVSRSVEVEARYIKQTGGAGDYAVVKLRVEPGEPGSGFAFSDETRGGVVPKEFVPAVRQGCEEVCQSGELAGYPVVDLRVALVDGAFHEVDSSERSFKIAGSMAMREGLREAGPVLLEPTMEVEVVTPEEFVGAVQGDLNGRRGQITGFDSRGGQQVIRALVPLATMFGYVNSLRSLTQGRATFTMQFSHYTQVPESVLQTILRGTGW